MLWAGRAKVASWVMFGIGVVGTFSSGSVAFGTEGSQSEIAEAVFWWILGGAVVWFIAACLVSCVTSLVEFKCRKEAQWENLADENSEETGRGQRFTYE